jgi:cellulose synthase (UDP-forming)
MLAVLLTTAGTCFWYIWFQANAGSVTSSLFIPLTIALAYDGTFLPLVYLYYVGRMRRPRPVSARAGLRVALITLCVPSTESLDVITAQLRALTQVSYPHDSWVLDEGNDPEVRREAERLGICYFSRRGVGRYNQPAAPFQAKTKAGNVNAWIDSHGSSYDYFVQFDIDHRPEPHYLDRVLGYFVDPMVGWVQAPSLYRNLENWIARGAAEQELVLQGPLQQGFYGSNQTPFIIGSHCTYRMSAIREIGGFQPTRAEDHLDSLVLATRGYRGVFVPEILALGQGPETFEMYLRQQFAWAYSMMQILFTRAPYLLWRCRPRQALQFLFAESWYPLWSTSMLVLFCAPTVALLASERPSAIDLPTFLLASAPLTTIQFVVWQWTRRWHLPPGLGLSWRGVTLHVARWPVIVWALINVVLRIRHPYMITPKGTQNDLPYLSLASQGLYVGLAIMSVGAIWLHSVLGSRLNDGYVLCALLSALWMLLVVTTNVVGNVVALVRRRTNVFQIVRLRLVPVTIMCLVALGIAQTVNKQAGQIEAASGLTGDSPWQPIAVLAYGLTNPSGRTRTSADLAFNAATVKPNTSPDVVAGRSGSRSIAADASTLLARGPTRPATTPTEAARSVAPVVLSPGRIVVGAYDPQHALDSTPFGLDHVFLNDDEPGRLADALATARGQRILMATIEMARLPGNDSTTLEALLAGRYDANFKLLAQIVRNQKPQDVLIRWGQEMDLAGLYPWSVGDPSLYRAAFRRVVSLFRDAGATNARFVWSPAGTDRAVDFYPGADVVDYTGLTILGDATWDSLYGLPPQSFRDILQPRYDVLAPFAKPLILAEVGVSGSTARQSAWLAEAATSIGDFPAVRAFVYFNGVNAPNNHRATQPDWHLRPTDFARFVQRITVGDPTPSPPSEPTSGHPQQLGSDRPGRPA